MYCHQTSQILAEMLFIETKKTPVTWKEIISIHKILTCIYRGIN